MRLTPFRHDDDRDAGSCRIKGNISRDGERIYHLPGGQYYGRIPDRCGEGRALVLLRDRGPGGRLAEVAPVMPGPAVPALPIRSAHGRSTRARSSCASRSSTLEQLRGLDCTLPSGRSPSSRSGGRSRRPAFARRRPDPAALPATVALRGAACIAMFGSAHRPASPPLPVGAVDPCEPPGRRGSFPPGATGIAPGNAASVTSPPLHDPVISPLARSRSRPSPRPHAKAQQRRPARNVLPPMTRC